MYVLSNLKLAVFRIQKYIFWTRLFRKFRIPDSGHYTEYIDSLMIATSVVSMLSIIFLMTIMHYMAWMVVMSMTAVVTAVFCPLC